MFNPAPIVSALVTSNLIKRNMKKTTETTPTGKIVDTVEHEDGRKSVTVHVDTIRVENPDEGDKAAEKIINEKVIPKLKETEVMVMVLHKATNQFAQFVCNVTQVREFAMKVIQGFPVGEGYEKPPYEDFVVIETQGSDQRVTVIE